MKKYSTLCKVWIKNSTLALPLPLQVCDPLPAPLGRIVDLRCVQPIPPVAAAHNVDLAVESLNGVGGAGDAHRGGEEAPSEICSIVLLNLMETIYHPIHIFYLSIIIDVPALTSENIF